MITTDLPAGPLRSGPARLSRAFSRTANKHPWKAQHGSRNLLFFLNLCRKSTTPAASRAEIRDDSSCLYVTQRIDTTTMPNDGNDNRENLRGSGFATGAESASSVAKRFCTGLNNDA